jgi:hypothetical protein
LLNHSNCLKHSLVLYSAAKERRRRPSNRLQVKALVVRHAKASGQLKLLCSLHSLTHSLTHSRVVSRGRLIANVVVYQRITRYAHYPTTLVEFDRHMIDYVYLFDPTDSRTHNAQVAFARVKVYVSIVH